MLTVVKKSSIKKNQKCREFPHGPLVRTSHSHCRGLRFNPCSQAVWWSQNKFLNDVFLIKKKPHRRVEPNETHHSQMKISLGGTSPDALLGLCTYGKINHGWGHLRTTWQPCSVQAFVLCVLKFQFKYWWLTSSQTCCWLNTREYH